jgi:heme exporter protein CcmD
MGGRGVFVWGAFGLSFALLAAEVLMLRVRACQAKKSLIK